MPIVSDVTVEFESRSKKNDGMAIRSIPAAPQTYFIKKPSTPKKMLFE
jgi:hypothetical protein